MKTSSETFTQRVKRELSKNKYSSAEAKALLCALFKQNAQLGIVGDFKTLEIRLKSAPTLQLVYSLLKSAFAPAMNTSANDALNESGYRTYELQISSKVDEMLSALGLNADVPPRHLLSNRKSRLAYVIGAFLAGGFVSEPSASTPDLEISANNDAMANLIIEILHERGFQLKLRMRRGINICYLKKADRIADLLKLFNAIESTLAFEDARISRDLAWQLSKLNNIDIANQQKTIKAAASLIDDIKFINKAGKLRTMPPNAVLFCKLRVAYPEESLTLLVKRMGERGIVVSKAALNHYGRFVRKIAASIK